MVRTRGVLFGVAAEAGAGKGLGGGYQRVLGWGYFPAESGHLRAFTTMGWFTEVPGRLQPPFQEGGSFRPFVWGFGVGGNAQYWMSNATQLSQILGAFDQANLAISDFGMSFAVDEQSGIWFVSIGLAKSPINYFSLSRYRTYTTPLTLPQGPQR